MVVRIHEQDTHFFLSDGRRLAMRLMLVLIITLPDDLPVRSIAALDIVTVVPALIAANDFAGKHACARVRTADRLIPCYLRLDRVNRIKANDHWERCCSLC